MTIEVLISLIGLALAMIWTPGPNNTLLANSGANFGFRKSVPHILGVALGFAFMVFLVGLGLGVLFEKSKLLQQALQLVSVALLLWIAYKIWTSGSVSSSKGEKRPFTFLEASAFQWVNPKGWSMAMAVTAQFAVPGKVLMTASIITVVFALAGLTSSVAWVGLGQSLQNWLKNPVRLRLFNRIMAVTIVLSVILLFLKT